MKCNSCWLQGCQNGRPTVKNKVQMSISSRRPHLCPDVRICVQTSVPIRNNPMDRKNPSVRTPPVYADTSRLHKHKGPSTWTPHVCADVYVHPHGPLPSARTQSSICVDGALRPRGHHPFLWTQGSIL
jgi:hypothetical protein